MKIITWNVNGIRALAKKGLFEFLQHEDPDVMCLQETKAHPDQVEPMFLTACNRVSYWSAAKRKGYSGTATFLRGEMAQVDLGIGEERFDSEGRFVVTHHGSFILYNVYFPNGGSGEERHLFKQDFLKVFTEHLTNKIKEGHEVIVVGDYNVAHLDIDVHNPVQLSTESGFLPEERAWFGRFLEAGFVDVYRHFYPAETGKYTWWSYKEMGKIGNRGWRIDHICVTKGLIDKVKSIEIRDSQEGSDHCPVIMNIDI